MKIAYWPFCIAASRSADYGFVVVPEPVDQRGLRQAFRVREFAINRATDGVAHTVLKSEGTWKPLHFWYCTQPNSIRGEELRDPAGRRLFRSLGFATENVIVEARIAEFIIALVTAELMPQLTAFLAVENANSEPVISECRLYHEGAGGKA